MPPTDRILTRKPATYSRQDIETHLIHVVAVATAGQSDNASTAATERELAGHRTAPHADAERKSRRSIR
jgi:hypothetical protein